jgi:hypothetical protein
MSRRAYTSNKNKKITLFGRRRFDAVFQVFGNNIDGFGALGLYREPNSFGWVSHFVGILHEPTSERPGA